MSRRLPSVSPHSFILVVLFIAVARIPFAQEEADEKWDVTLARGETRQIEFVADKGTWMSVDVAPDDRSVVFDLLGHIYNVPSSGGTAVCLTQDSGVAVNFHPRYSPDGKTIAFVSDRKGQNNLWVMDVDGSNPRSVFQDGQVQVSTPTWTPDSQYIVVQRVKIADPGQTPERGLSMFHVSGGKGVELVGRDVSGASWPSVSKDGRFLYFQATNGGREADALTGRYQIKRFEFQTGDVIDITAGTAYGAAAGRLSSGGAFAPEISPDGRFLAFGRQISDGTITFKGHTYGPRTALWILDLERGSERLLADPISVAIESGSKSSRILPGYAWAEDGTSIVLSRGGRIERVRVNSGESSPIPFEAPVSRTISEMAYRPFRVSDEPFESRFLRWPTSSPDGTRLAFQAIGRIWIMDLPEGTPRRLTPADFAPQEFGPAWSPDGSRIAWTSWKGGEGGHLWTIESSGGAPRQITSQAGEYLHPAWSPDGSELVLVKGKGATFRHRTLTHNPAFDVIRISADGGEATTIATVAVPPGTSLSSYARRAVLHPSFGPENRIFFPSPAKGPRPGSLQTELVSVRIDGSDRRTHMVFPNADEAVPSPDGKWIASQDGDNLYLTPFPWLGTGGGPVEGKKKGGGLPSVQLSREGGLFARWRSAGLLEYGSGHRYYTYDVDSKETTETEIRLQVSRRIPQGTIALANARIITLSDAGVVEKGTVVVNGSRIQCVGECAGVPVDRTVNLDGRTVIPGFIDMHSHHYREHRGYRPRRDYETAIYLAYGVTTSLDNSMWSQNIFPTAEMIEAGEMIGPRTFSTGDPVYRGDGPRQNDLTSYEVAEQNVNRLASWGAVSIKQYMQPRREQRQWVSHAARKRGVMVTAEGGDLNYNLGMIMDGQTAWEHPMSYVPIYSDVARFFGRANAVYSPTFVVAGPGPWNIDFFFAEQDLWQDSKQQRWMPWRMLTHLRRRPLRPKSDYSFPLLAQGLADIIAEGGYGSIGSHGEHHGLAAQWEVWMAASALGPLGALEVASRHGAHFLGAEQDLGTLEVGKLADLIVLGANPLEDIRRTLDMRYVMKGGVLYESETLDEVWPENRPFGPYYWVDEASLQSDTKPIRQN